MAHPLQKAAVRRKIFYFALIAVLFCITLFWRGKLDVPLGNPTRAADEAPTALNRGADWLAKRSVVEQATHLDLRELDQGDPELFTSVARHSLVGMRGFVVTGLWWGAIEKQKRGEFGEFEFLARLATRLQPHFITPWLFQSWNITYNISVLNDNLTDMYFYIARGIELLAQGDRLNTKRYVAENGEEYPVASPDLRYWLATYYQNKFTVSDTVSTLRSLMQLSCIPPGQRQADSLLIDGVEVNKPAFEKFCRDNPQLIRRLQTKLNCQRPEDVIRFLKDNESIPSRFDDQGELATRMKQFPVLPPDDGTAKEYRNQYEDEYSPKDGPDVIDDTFDAVLAARGWFRYAEIVVVPPVKDASGRPLPWSTPQPGNSQRVGEYDPLLYRMPARPALILFRMAPARAQTYHAQRLTEEGWFDTGTTFNPNSNVRVPWFAPKPAASGGTENMEATVALTTPSASQQAYDKAWQMWDQYGEDNGLLLSTSDLNSLKVQAGFPGNQPDDQIPMPPTGLGTPTDEILERTGQTRNQNIAWRALVFARQNREMSQFDYFYEMCDAQRSDIAIKAQELLWKAEQAKKEGNNLTAIRLYAEGLATWRDMLREFPKYHHTRLNRFEAQEETYNNQVELMQLLKIGGPTRQRAETVVRTLPVLFPWLSVPEENTAKLAQAVPLPGIYEAVESEVAEDEAETRITLAEMQQPSNRLTQAQQQAKQFAIQMQDASGAVAGGPLVGGLLGMTAIEQGSEFNLTPETASDAMLRTALSGEYEWMKQYKQSPTMGPRGILDPTAFWVEPSVRSSVRLQLNLDIAPQNSAETDEDPTLPDRSR